MAMALQENACDPAGTQSFAWSYGLYVQPRTGAQERRVPFPAEPVGNGLGHAGGMACEKARLMRRRSGPAKGGSAETFTAYLGGADFSGSIETRLVGGLPSTRIVQSDRTLAQTSFAARDQSCCYILLQVAAQTRIKQADREAVVRPGDIVLVNTSRPADFRFEGRNILILTHVPQQEMDRIWPHWRAATAVPVRRGPARMIGSLIQTAFENIAGANTPQETVIREAILALLASSFSEESAEADAGQGSASVAGMQLRLVQDYIINNLGDCDLTPSAIAVATRISERRLHRLFAATGTSVCQWIRQTRLDRCVGDLADPNMRDDSITVVAFRWGFNDAAYFSRVFRQQFGVPPREYRASVFPGGRDH